MVEAVSRVKRPVVSVGMGKEMEFANESPMVAGAAENTWESFRLLWDGDTHMCDSQRGAVLPCQQTQTTRHADRVLDNTVREIDAPVGEPIQIRRPNVRVAVGLQRIPSLLIGVQHKYVRSAHDSPPVFGELPGQTRDQKIDIRIALSKPCLSSLRLVTGSGGVSARRNQGLCPYQRTHT